MKPRFLFPILIIATLAGLTLTFAQNKRNRAPKEFMREKLELSQKVLEGLALENYDLIVSRATRLSAMSKEVDWRVFDNPEYDQQSVIFRRQVDALAKAAKEKNLDAATLAYVRMTMSCIDCHKLVRGKLVASMGAWMAGGQANPEDQLPRDRARGSSLDRSGATDQGRERTCLEGPGEFGVSRTRAGRLDRSTRDWSPIPERPKFARCPTPREQCLASSRRDRP